MTSLQLNARNYKLKDIKNEDLIRWKLEGDFDVKVVTVYDGDTCDLVLEENGWFRRFKCRLAGIDAPELKAEKAKQSRNFLAWLCVGNDPEEFSRRSKPFDEEKLQNLLDENETVIFARIKGTKDRYGRPLVTLMSNDRDPKSFNQMLIEKDYAKEYQPSDSK